MENRMSRIEAHPRSLEYFLQAVAQIRAHNSPEREAAHCQSRLESDSLFGPLLGSGVTICRTILVMPDDPGIVHEFYRFHQDDGELLNIPLHTLRYYRFAAGYAGPPRTLKQGNVGAALYRHLPLVRAGRGVGALRPGANDTSRRSNRILPLERRLIHDEQQRIYRVPVPTPLGHRLYDEQAPDRWHMVRAALLEAGRTEAAALSVRVVPSWVEPVAQAYLERAARLLGETPGQDDARGQEARRLLDLIAAGPRAYVVEIHASTAEVARAFCADVGGQALIETRPQLPELDEEDRLLKTLLTRLASVFTMEEVAALLTPSITFRDALPGATHFTPPQLVTMSVSGTARSAHHDSEGDFTIGTRNDGSTVLMNTEWLRTGTTICGPPGTGKTTAAGVIVRHVSRLRGSKTAIQIFDPVGFEWLGEAEALGARVYRFGDRSGPSLMFNPFLAPPDVSLADHSMTLATLMTAVWPGTNIAREYLHGMIRATYRRIYQDRANASLDLLRATGRDQQERPGLWPDFATFLGYGHVWLAAQANAEQSRHLAESVEYFRLRSRLMSGSLLAEVLSGGEALYPQLERSFVLALGGIGSREIKAAIHALVLGLYLNAIRTGGTQQRPRLERLIVLEEAHDIVGKPANGHGQEEMANSASDEVIQSVRDLLTTGRKFGVGLLVLDQSLSSLDESVVKNCANMIALRTLYGPDQDVAARVLGLSPEERGDLSHLATGEAVVRLEGFPYPQHMRLDRE